MQSKFIRYTAGFSAAILAVTQLAAAFPAAAAQTVTSKEYVYEDYSVNYEITNSWDNTEIVTATLTNTGSEVLENWMLYFTPNGLIHDLVGIEEAATAAGTTYFRNKGYNAKIEPSQSTTFSYAVDDCTAAPDQFTLCTTRKSKANGIEVTLGSYSSWGSSFNGVITVTNQSDRAVHGWELDFNTNCTITDITNSWAASVTTLGTGHYLLKGNYNSMIEPHSSIQIGFIGEMNGDPVITDYSLTEIEADEPYINRQNHSLEYTISDLEELNEDSPYELEVEQKTDGTLHSIDGKFSTISVLDTASALDSLYGIRTLLGMNDPASELELDYIYDSETADYKSYFFNQVYEGIPVYGRTVTIVAKDAGETLSMESDYHSVAGANTTPGVSAESVKSQYQFDNAELVIYSYDEFENAPALMYMMKHDDVIYLVSAEDGTLYTSWNDSLDGQPQPEAVPLDTLYRDDTNSVLVHLDRSSVIVTNETDAENAVLNLPTGLDLSNGRDEIVYVDKYVTQFQTSYFFEQKYNGLRVYGRQLTLVAKDDQLKSVDSNFVQIPASFTFDKDNPGITKPNDQAELVIYTWDEDEKEAAPQLAYIFDDLSNQRTVIQFADSEPLYKPLGKGVCETRFDRDENGVPQLVPPQLYYFPVTVENNKYYLSTRKASDTYGETEELPGKTEVRLMYTSMSDTALSADKPYFYNPEAVGVYRTILRVRRFFSKTSGLNNYRFVLNESSYLNIGLYDMIVGVNNYSNTDNAYSANSYIYVTERTSSNPTYGNGIDVLGHEYGHGLFRQFAVAGQSYPYYTMVGGINEGYADVFGALCDGDWAMFDHNRGSSALNGDRDATHKIRESLTIDFETTENPSQWGHGYIPFVLRSAYLISQNADLSRAELAQLFYDSLSQGRYGRTSTMNSVRTNLLKAAKARNYTPEKRDAIIAAIIAASNEVRENDIRLNSYQLKVNVKDYELGSSAIDKNVTTITLKDSFSDRTYNLKSNEASYVKPGYYTMVIKNPDYLTYRDDIYMSYGNKNLSVDLVKESNIKGTVNVVLKDYVSQLPADGQVVLKQIHELPQDDVIIGTFETGAAVGQSIGQTGPISVVPGYYTISVVGAGNAFVKDVNVTPGKSTTLTFNYHDTNIDKNNKTDLIQFDVEQHTEDTYANGLNFDAPSLDHSRDADNNAIARTIQRANHFGFQNFYYLYERENEVFDLTYSISAAQYQQLLDVAEAERNVDPNHQDHGKYLTVTAEIINHANGYRSTLVLVASDLISRASVSEGRYNVKLAEIQYSSADHCYVVVTDPAQFAH